MRLQDDIDFTTLTWVKQELDDTLKQAQQALEAYVEDSSDKSQMRFCASYLHQVQGTLRMVELYGAAMVVEEMERLALGLLDGQIKQAEDAYTVLMRGMVQLPDYLERLQSGHRDIPIVLLPLLNDLRACRGEKLLSETALFSPDLGAALPASAAGAKTSVAQPLLAVNGGRLRLAFQFGLLKWFKGEDVDGNLARLIAVVDRVRSLCVQLDARRLWWVSAAALEAVLVKGLDASVALKLLVGRVDRELKRLIDSGEAAFSSNPPNDLTKGLLYYVAQSTATSPRVAELRQVYRLDKLMPSEAELKHARGALSGHNRALLDTVGTAIKEDLLRVKDALDLYLRTSSTNVDDLAPQGDALHRVADTLGMLGLGVPRRVVLDQQDVLERIVQGKQTAEESTLLDIAGSLLYVESSLDDHIDRLGADQRVETVPSSGFELPQAEVRKILDATTKEASANLQQAKQDIVAFIESPWDHSKIEQIPRLLEEISGALRMLNLPEPAALLGGVVRFAEVELLRHRRVPSGDQLDLMADAIASIEFYLEAVKEGRRNRDKILEVTRRSLEALGYWPIPSEDAGIGAETVTIEPTVTQSAPSSTDFPSFGEGFSTDRIESAASIEPVQAVADNLAPTPSPADAVDALIASFGATPDAADATHSLPPVAEPEMRSAVEIAPGDSLDALVVGETATEAHAPSVHNLDGLRLSGDDAHAAVEHPVAGELHLDTSSDWSLPDSTAEPAEVLTELAADELVAADTSSEFLWEATAPADATPSAAIELSLDQPFAEADQVSVEELVASESWSAPIDTQESVQHLEVPAPEPVVEALAPEPTPVPPVDVPAVVQPPVAAPPLVMPQGIQLPDVGFHSVPSDEIDDEIREVFVEEVQDELDNLNRQYPAWKHDLGDFEKLKPVRRSFHTLKGSGRLVGALAIGEYAWKIENMLNRILDKTIQPTPAVLDLLDHAIAALPGMLAALKGEGQPASNVGTIMWVADQLVTGQEVWLPKSSPARVVTAENEPTSEAGSEAVAVEAPIASAELATAEADHDDAVVLGSTASTHAEAADVFAVAASVPLADVLEAAAPTAVDATSTVVDASVEPPTTEVEERSASPLDVDPMLMEILSSEVSSHLSTIHHYLDQTSADFAPPVTEEVLRAVHTLNGALSMVDLPVLTRVVAPLEGYLKRLRARGLEPSSDGVLAISEAASCIAQVMQALEKQAEVPDTELLAARVVALRDDLPAPDHPYHGFGIHDADEHRTDINAEPEGAANEADPLPWYEAEEAEGAVPAELADVELTAVFDADDAVTSAADEAAVVADDTGDALTDVEAGDAIEQLADLSDVAEADVATDLLVDVSDLLPAGEELGESVDIDLLLPGLVDDGEALDVVEAADAPADVELSSSVDQHDLDWLSAEIEQTPAEATATPVNLAEVSESSDLLDLLDGVLEPEAIESDALPSELEYLDTDGPDNAVGLADLSSLQGPDEDADANEAAGFVVEAESAAESDAVADLDAIGLDLLEPDLIADADVLAIDETMVLADPAPSVEEESAVLFAETTDHTLAELDDTASPAVDLIADLDAEAPVLEDTHASDAEPLLASIVPDHASLDAAPVEELYAVDDAAEAAPALVEAFATELPADASVAPANVPDEPKPVSGGAADIDPDGPLDLPDMDLELLDIFVEEGVDILDHADGMMARLRETPDDRETVAALQRDLHTLKGGARMAGLAPIGDLSHAMESLFEAMAHGQRSTTRPALDALERAFDRMHGMVQRVRARLSIGHPEQTIARLEAIMEGREIAQLPEPVVAEAARTSDMVIESDTATAAEPTPEAVIRTAPIEATAPVAAPARPTARRTQLDDDEATARAAQQELIRVRADLLDNLVNFAGEVSIYRSRLEAQMGGFRFNLVEFEQTVLRLREQLRKLEMETEAQILSRFQRESEQSGNTEFDPLELDRFSTLQQLSRALAESVSDLVSIQNLLDDIARQSETLLLQQSRVSSDLQEGLMRTRMVPFESLVPRLRRILRQTAGELGKKAQLKVEGTQGEMDRTVLERMTAPFEHMLRNSLAHGIEPPQVRRGLNKPEEGTVAIKVAREATEVLIQVTDDGSGMNRDAIRRKAIERGLMNPDAQLSDRDIFQFVLEAGFSTASTVSKVSGRGVGMDVVASEVKQLGGSLEIDSELGKGTRITIRLPFTLAVAQAVMVRLGDSTFAIPMSSITGVTRMPRKEYDRRLEQKQLELSYGGEAYQIYDLGDLLRSPVSHGIDETQVPLLMSKTGDQRAAVRVTQVVGSKEVVVKSAGAQLSAVPGIFGATIMGDGRVVVILDLAPLVRHGVALRQAPEIAAELELLEPIPEPVARRQPLVMVVDDSITMRKVTTRVLERSNFDVFTAKDGLDAVEQLQDRIPDVILLDIEMPRMDGYEVATYIRNDPRLKHIPIIMITSRTGEKHRQRALEVGVDRYLGKPYQEADLLKNVQDALTAGHANVH